MAARVIDSNVKKERHKELNNSRGDYEDMVIHVQATSGDMSAKDSINGSSALISHHDANRETPQIFED